MSDTYKSELVKQINDIKDRLAGRNRTHQEVAKRSGWSRIELENVIKEDGWIYEDEMLTLITQQCNQARIDEIDRVKKNSEEAYLGVDWWADESIKDKSAHEVPVSYFEKRIAELQAQAKEQS